jgi:hypothetical protein
MKVYTVYQIVQKIKAWQNAGFLHPMTCGKDSKHAPLVAQATSNEVVLKCPDCDYVQEYIPDAVLRSEPEDLRKAKEEFKKGGFVFDRTPE